MMQRVAAATGGSSARVEEFEQLLGRSRWQRFRAFVRFAFRWADAGMPDPVDMSLTYQGRRSAYAWSFASRSRRSRTRPCCRWAARSRWWSMAPDRSFAAALEGARTCVVR